MTTAQLAYQKFLKTPLWKSLRHRALQRDGGKCVRCGSDKSLNVHHKRYRKLWELTRMEDLETLCRDHHKEEHKTVPKRGWFWTREEDLEYTKWMMKIYIDRIMKGRKLGRIAEANIQSMLVVYTNSDMVIGYVRRIRLFSEIMGIDA